LSIHVGNVEDVEEQIERYVNRLRINIQAKVSIVMIRNIEEAYQCVLRVEEKLARRKKGSFRGRVKPT
jgi:hypothetical protein